MEANENTGSQIIEEGNYEEDYNICEEKNVKESEFDIFVDKNKEYLASMLDNDVNADDFIEVYKGYETYEARFEFINGMMLEKLKGEYSYESTKAILKKLSYRDENGNLSKNWPDESVDYIISEFVKTDNFKKFTVDVLSRKGDLSYIIYIYDKSKSINIAGIEEIILKAIESKLCEEYDYKSIGTIWKNLILLEYPQFPDIKKCNQEWLLINCKLNKKFVKTKNFILFIENTLEKKDIEEGWQYLRYISEFFETDQSKNKSKLLKSEYVFSLNEPSFSVIYDKIKGKGKYEYDYDYNFIKRILYNMLFQKFPDEFVKSIVSNLSKGSNFTKFLSELLVDKDEFSRSYLDRIFDFFSRDYAEKIMTNLMAEKLLFEERYNCDNIKVILENIKFFKCGFKPVVNDNGKIDTKIGGFIDEKTEENIITEFTKTNNFNKFICDVICENGGFWYLDHIFNALKENTACVQKVITENIKNKLNYLWSYDIAKVLMLLANIDSLDCIDNLAKRNIILELTKSGSFIDVILNSTFQSNESSLEAIDSVFKHLGEIDIKNIKNSLVCIMSENFFNEEKYNYDYIYKLLHNISLAKQFKNFYLKNIYLDIYDKIKLNSNNVRSNLKHFISDSLVRKDGYRGLCQVLESLNNDKCASDTSDINNIENSLVSITLEFFFEEKKYNYDNIYNLLNRVSSTKQFENIRDSVSNKIKTSDDIGPNLKHFIADSLVRKNGYQGLNQILEFFNNDKRATDTIEKLILIAFKEISGQKHDHKNMKKLLFNIIVLTEDDRFKNLFGDAVTEFVKTDDYKAFIADLSKEESKSIQDIANLKLFRKLEKFSKPVPKLGTEKSDNNIEDPNK